MPGQADHAHVMDEMPASELGAEAGATRGFAQFAFQDPVPESAAMADSKRAATSVVAGVAATVGESVPDVTVPDISILVPPLRSGSPKPASRTI